jgi:hypothetical protein
VTPNEHARDLTLRLAAMRPESETDVSDLLVWSFDNAIKQERARCAAIVMARAAKWNEAAQAGAHGDCAESLADECEDIAVAIRSAT